MPGGPWIGSTVSFMRCTAAMVPATGSAPPRMSPFGPERRGGGRGDQVVDRAVPSLAALVRDDVGDGRGDRVGVERPVRMERETVGEQVFLATSGNDRDPAFGVVDRFDADGDRGSVWRGDGLLVAAPELGFLRGKAIGPRDRASDRLEPGDGYEAAKRVQVVEDFLVAV